MKNNLSGLAQHILDIRIGAKLRGVEAIVDGHLERRDGEILLIIGSGEAPLLLSQLSQKVQIRLDLKKRRKRAESITRQERNAYARLAEEVARLQHQQPSELRARITGPLQARSSPDGTVLQVRKFQINMTE